MDDRNDAELSDLAGSVDDRLTQLARLEADGLIRGASEVELTAEGRALHRSLSEHVTIARVRLLSQFNVDDIETSRAELEAKGVQFVGETFDTGVCKMALFRDPDGNDLMLHHRYAPREGGS